MYPPWTCLKLLEKPQSNWVVKISKWCCADERLICGFQHRPHTRVLFGLDLEDDRPMLEAMHRIFLLKISFFKKRRGNRAPCYIRSTKNLLVIHAFEFASYATGGFCFLKHRGFLAWPITRSGSFFVPDIFEPRSTVTRSLLSFPDVQRSP